MSFGKKKNVKNIKELPPEAQEAIDNGPQSSGAMQMGLNNTNIPEPVPFLDQAECEVIYKNNNNAWIVLGRDRPGPKTSGYGGQGATQAGSIDLVAGRMGATKDGPKSNIYTQPNFAGDAARIYISQKTDIDANFSLVAGKVGLSVARSGIGIKADAVRVIGREGIKLVTGTVPRELNSSGEKLTTTYGIDLIAGNDDETTELEPMVKGTSLVNAMRDMSGRIDELNGLYNTLVLVLISHVHPPFMVPSPNLAIMGLLQASIPSFGHKLKIMADQVNNLEPFGGGWLLSRYNRVN
tara:strand:+ start:302 stop:1186 length:885 start_codon:yes stop_codon:yes gene_type:complete